MNCVRCCITVCLSSIVVVVVVVVVVVMSRNNTRISLNVTYNLKKKKLQCLVTVKESKCQSHRIAWGRVD